jgi:hypothetical protein
MLTLRHIGLDDYNVRDDQSVRRIGHVAEHSPPLWLWHITVGIPGAPFGDAPTLDEAKGWFGKAWQEFKQRHGPEKPAKALAMDWANRVER